MTRTASFLPSATPTPTLTPNAGTATPSPTLGAATPGGTLEILRAVLHPHPVRGASVELRLRLSGPAESLRVRVYTPALVLVEELELHQHLAEGWSRVRLDLVGLPPGLSYLSLQARDGGRASLPVAPLRLVRLP